MQNSELWSVNAYEVVFIVIFVRCVPCVMKCDEALGNG